MAHEKKSTKPKKTYVELQAELDLLKRQRRSGEISTVLRDLIRWGGVAVVAYFFYLSVASLAGETTAADIGIAIAGQLEVSDAFAILFGGGGVAYGMGQRRLRRRTIERLQERIRSLEQQIDPGRSSSGLDSQGRTHPQDI